MPTVTSLSGRDPVSSAAALPARMRSCCTAPVAPVRRGIMTLDHLPMWSRIL